MRMSLSLKASVIVIAAVASWIAAGPAGASDRCLQCLTRDGCFENCGCECNNPSHAMTVLGCNDDGSLLIQCRDSSTNPPSYGSSHCAVERGQCPLPSCQLDGTWCNYPSECCSYICGDSSRTCGQPTPIMINLKNDSSNYHLTDAAGGVTFDIDADGTTEHISWTEGDSEIAILAMDRNGNHTIDDGSELFGNATAMADGTSAPNGFEALIDLDGGAADGDGQIRSTDPAYAQLLVWLDSNHNGVSEPWELQTLPQAGIQVIFTGYRESPRVDRNGNAYKLVGDILVEKKNGEASLRRIFDVYLTAGPPP